MGNFRDYLNEARNTSVPTEFRIALGQLKRMYNAGEVPEKKELLKDIEMIAKKNHLDSDKFLEFALAQFKMNEADEDVSEAKMETAEFDKIINLLNTKRTEQAKKEYNALSKTDKELFNIYLGRSKVDVAKDVKKMLGLNESAVGAPGRTTVKDAEDHIDDELLAEFKKIIKKLGGKTVAKVLLDKLGQKVEIKDEIDHIEDIIDNSNY